MTATSPYDELTPEAIKASMLADLQTKGVDISTREGSYSNMLVSVGSLSAVQNVPAVPKSAAHGISGRNIRRVH